MAEEKERGVIIQVVAFLPHMSSLGMSDHGEKIMVKIIKAEIDLFGIWNDIERKAHQVVG